MNQAKLKVIEERTRYALLGLSIGLTATGWLLDHRGYLQGVGMGMAFVLGVWLSFDNYRNKRDGGQR